MGCLTEMETITKSAGKGVTTANTLTHGFDHCRANTNNEKRFGCESRSDMAISAIVNQLPDLEERELESVVSYIAMIKCNRGK